MLPRKAAREENSFKQSLHPERRQKKKLQGIGHCVREHYMNEATATSDLHIVSLSLSSQVHLATFLFNDKGGRTNCSR